MEDIPDGGFEHMPFKAGDVGVVVHIVSNGAGYLLEMFAADGSTLDVISVEAHQVRAVTDRDILCVRDLESDTLSAIMDETT